MARLSNTEMTNKRARLKISLSCLFAVILPLFVDAQAVVVDKPQFRSVFNLQTQCPSQVEWTLHRSDIGKASRSSSWTFLSDVADARALVTHYDYTASGYDRGHMCPALDRSRSLSDMQATFVVSNICPQVPAVNRGTWKQTETTCRRLATVYDSVAIVSVPVFLHRDTTFIGRHRVAVPHAFFKAVWLPARDSVLACWFIFNH